MCFSSQPDKPKPPTPPQAPQLPKWTPSSPVMPQLRPTPDMMNATAQNVNNYRSAPNPMFPAMQSATPQATNNMGYVNPQGTSLTSATPQGAQISGTNIGYAPIIDYHQGLTPEMVQGGLNRLDTGMGLANRSYNTLGNMGNLFLKNANNAANPDYNPAIGAFRSATMQNMMNTSSALASQRGTSVNPGLAARNIGVMGALNQQMAVNQMSSLVGQYKTAQDQNAVQAFSSQGQMAAAYGQMAAAYSSAALTNQGQILNAISNQNAANVAMQSNVNTSNVAMQSNINSNNVAMQSNINNNNTAMASNLNASNVAMQSNINNNQTAMMSNWNNANVAMQSNLNNNNTAMASNLNSAEASIFNTINQGLFNYTNNLNNDYVAMQSNLNNNATAMASNINSNLVSSNNNYNNDMTQGTMNMNNVNAAQNLGLLQSETSQYQAMLNYLSNLYASQTSGSNNTNNNTAGLVSGLGLGIMGLLLNKGGQVPQKYSKGGQVEPPKYAKGGRIPEPKRKKMAQGGFSAPPQPMQPMPMAGPSMHSSIPLDLNGNVLGEYNRLNANEPQPSSIVGKFLKNNSKINNVIGSTNPRFNPGLQNGMVQLAQRAQQAMNNGNFGETAGIPNRIGAVNPVMRGVQGFDIGGPVEQKGVSMPNLGLAGSPNQAIAMPPTGLPMGNSQTRGGTPLPAPGSSGNGPMARGGRVKKMADGGMAQGSGASGAQAQGGSSPSIMPAPGTVAPTNPATPPTAVGQTALTQPFQNRDYLAPGFESVGAGFHGNPWNPDKGSSFQDNAGAISLRIPGLNNAPAGYDKNPTPPPTQKPPAPTPAPSTGGSSTSNPYLGYGGYYGGYGGYYGGYGGYGSTFGGYDPYGGYTSGYAPVGYATQTSYAAPQNYYSSSMAQPYTGGGGNLSSGLAQGFGSWAGMAKGGQVKPNDRVILVPPGGYRKVK